MKKKMDLSIISYLEYEIHVGINKLVVLNIFSGFFQTEFDQTLDVLN